MMIVKRPGSAAATPDRTRSRTRAGFGDDSGETVIGTAVLFPIVLFGLFMIIQLLLGYYVRSVASAAATDAAVLTAQENATAVQGEDYARNFILEQAGGLVLPGELSVVATKNGEFTTVTVTGRTRLVWGIALNANASAPVERFEPQEAP